MSNLSYVGTNSADGIVVGVNDDVPIGFFGATPVAPQVLGAAATDAATALTLANNLRTALINLGLGVTA